jgi:cysteine desulfurase
MDTIYLDNNATTRIDPRVAEAMYRCQCEGYVNPASQHRGGAVARRALEQARDEIGSLLDCRTSGRAADRVVFTSGGTEANNLALLGLAGRPPARILVSSIEHPSVMGPASRLAATGFDVRRIRAAADGTVDVDHLGELLTPDTRLVSVMLANSETGVLQPIRQIAERCDAAGVLLHTDAVQVAGKLPLSFAASGAQAMTLTAHKLHGPLGVGLLLLTPEVSLQPMLHGGFQQGQLRPGTESVALAVGFCEALRIWSQESDARTRRVRDLRDRLESEIGSRVPDLVINGGSAARLPNTANLSFPGIDRQELLLALDMAGVCCSTGTACASGSSEPSPVLTAMGLPESVIGSALRFSLGADTTPREVERAIDRICKSVNDLHNRKRRGKGTTPARN